MGRGSTGGRKMIGSRALTACSLDELLSSVLRLVLLEVDYSERRAPRLNERAAELVAKAARRPSHNSNLHKQDAQDVSRAAGEIEGAREPCWTWRSREGF